MAGVDSARPPVEKDADRSTANVPPVQEDVEEVEEDLKTEGETLERRYHRMEAVVVNMEIHEGLVRICVLWRIMSSDIFGLSPGFFGLSILTTFRTNSGELGRIILGQAASTSSVAI
jgi:hypothetical protein